MFCGEDVQTPPDKTSKRGCEVCCYGGVTCYSGYSENQ